MTDPRSLCMNIIFYRPISPATETHRPGTSLGFLPSEWSRAGNVKGHIGASSAALLNGVPSGAWSPRRPSRRSPRSCKPRKGRLRYRTLGPAIRIVRKRTTRRRSKSDSAASSSWRGAGGGPERAHERERERRAVLQASVMPARRARGRRRRACPAFPRRRGSAREVFSLTALLSRVWSMGCFLHASYFCQLKPMMDGVCARRPASMLYRAPALGIPPAGPR